MESLNPILKLLAMFDHILEVLGLVAMHIDTHLSSKHGDARVEF